MVSLTKKIIAKDSCFFVIRMSDICESWSLDELVQMTDQDMDKLLTHYPAGKTPTFQEVRN